MSAAGQVPLPAEGDWADHFSASATDYARYRPAYPHALFAWLAERAPARRRAWDAATGSGQAARRLAPHFGHVVASDGSARQLAAARGREGVTWVQCRCECVPLVNGSVDLVTVAQALHWLAPEPFFREVRRVSRPGTVVAAWSYALPRIHPPVDTLVRDFHDTAVGPWWPPGRHHVVQGLRHLPFPFEEIQAPPFTMRVSWTLAEMLGYLGTWSAVARARQATGGDPLAKLAAVLAPAWGDPGIARPVVWPLALRAGRLT